MTVTNKKLIGNHALASAASKFRNDIIRSFFTDKTHMTQTLDWMVRVGSFMEKLRPETTYCGAVSACYITVSGGMTRNRLTLTLLTTVITIDAKQEQANR